MNLWWRAYSDARHDPKLMLLSPEMFRAWFILVCLAADNNGQIKSITEIAFALRMNQSKAGATIDFLASKGLFDSVEGGYFEPHNWKQRQYKSDVSTKRVKEFRQRKRNVSEKDDETFHEAELKRPQNQNTENRNRETAAATRAGDLLSHWPAWLRVRALVILEPYDEITFDGQHGRIAQWLANGWDLELDILPAITRKLAERKTGSSPIRSIKFFEGAIADQHAARIAPIPLSEARKSNVRTPAASTAKTMLDVFDDVTADLAAKCRA